MSFQMTADTFDPEWFELVPSDTSSPATGIKIMIDGTRYFEAQSTFRFTDRTASKDADLSNLVLSSGVVDEDNPDDSTYKEYELTPTFEKDTLNYELNLLEYIDTMDIKVTSSDSSASMKMKVPKRDENDNLMYEEDGTTIVYEEKEIQNDIPLEFILNKLGEPDTIITIKVTAQDGATTNEYTVVIKRPYGIVKGTIYTEPTDLTTGKYIADILAFSKEDAEEVVDWDVAINNTASKLSDSIHDTLTGKAEEGGIIEKAIKETSNDDGTFEIMLIPGTYELVIDKEGYLDYIYINVDVSVGKTVDLNEKEPNERISLIAGDVNKDGIVSVLDKTIVTKQNGKQEGINQDYNSACDFNDDEKVEIKDKTILTKNNGKVRNIIDYTGGKV